MILTQGSLNDAENVRRIQPPPHRLLRGVLVCLLCIATGFADNLTLERDRMKTILSIVARDIEKNFYDENLGGIDWPTLTEKARQRIENANSVGEMTTAIFSLVNKLQDSHTIFLPPLHPHHAIFGFEAKAFGSDVRVYDLKKDGAAAAAGLKAGDRVISINNFAVDRTNIDLAMLVFRALRPVGAMDVVIARGTEPPRTIRVEGKIKEGIGVMDITNLNTIWQLIREWERERKIPEYKHNEEDVGYLKMSNFELAPETMRSWAKKLKDDKAVIIDLRDNPGGRSDSLAEFAGFFEQEQVDMVQVLSRRKSEPLKVKPQAPAIDAPLFILVDSRSASAAEMFARHFQIRGRGFVVGDRTSGRVSAARLFVERTGAEIVVPFAIEIATGRVQFPGGEELEKKGVTPDLLCIPTEDDLRTERDACLQTTLKLAWAKLGHTAARSDVAKQ